MARATCEASPSLSDIEARDPSGVLSHLMATAKNKSKATRTRKSATTKRARGKLAPGASARGLDAADVVIAIDSEEIADVVALIRHAGGALIGAYRDPLGGRPLVLASLPLSAVQPTPFQRDLSPTHAKRLAV
jgi:ParB family chromosome partitioning protein